MQPKEVSRILKDLADTLRQQGKGQGDAPNGLDARVESLLAEAEMLASETVELGGFVHLPEAMDTRREEDLSVQVRDAFLREREQLRANVLALQQERDTLRERVRQLEDEARQATSPTPAAKEPSAASVASTAVEFEAHDPSGHKRRMGDILVAAGVVSQEQLDSLIAENTGSKHKRLGALLVERGITTEEMIAKVLAAQLKLPYVDLAAFEIVEAAALQITGDLARRCQCIPIDGDLSRITLAMANPLDLVAIENVELSCNRRVAPAVAIPTAIDAAIARIYGAIG